MALAPYTWLKGPAEELSAMRNRLPNAILIYGAPGTGVFDLARSFAESLLCESPAGGGACGHCASCRLIRAGTHPDLRFVVSEYFADALELPYEPPPGAKTREKKTKSRKILVHQVRAISDFTALTSNRRGLRVVVIYPADMVREEPASALLKILEEPPEGLVFILAAENLDAVLPTIRSRSRLVRVPVPPREEALGYLKTQKVKNAEEALAMAGGAPLDAAGAPGSTPKLDPKVSKVLMNLLLEGRGITVASVANGFRECRAGFSVPPAALFISRWTCDLARVQAGVAPRYFVGEAQNLGRLARDANPKKLWGFEKDVLSMRRSAEHPLNPESVWESILLAYKGIF